MVVSLKEYGTKIKYKTWELKPEQFKTLPKQEQKNILRIIELKKRSSILSKWVTWRYMFISIVCASALIIVLLWNQLCPDHPIPKYIDARDGSLEISPNHSGFVWVPRKVLFMPLVIILVGWYFWFVPATIVLNIFYLVKIRRTINTYEWYLPLQKMAEEKNTTAIFNKLLKYHLWGFWGLILSPGTTKDNLFNKLVFYTVHPYKKMKFDSFYLGKRKINLQKYMPPTLNKWNMTAQNSRPNSLKEFGLKVRYGSWQLSSEQLKTLTKKDQKDVLFIVEFRKRLFSSRKRFLSPKLYHFSTLFHLIFFAIVLMINEFFTFVFFPPFAYGCGFSWLIWSYGFLGLNYHERKKWQRSGILSIKKWLVPLERIACDRKLSFVFTCIFYRFYRYSRWMMYPFIPFSSLTTNEFFDSLIYLYFYPNKKLAWQSEMASNYRSVAHLAELCNVPE